MRSTKALRWFVPPLLRKTPWLPPKQGPLLPKNEPVDEETIPRYNSKVFYPAKPGDVLAERYQILVKVGWGASSTVWLARNLHTHIEDPEEIVALKINNADCPSARERDTETHIASAGAFHPGRLICRTLDHWVEIDGPYGRHVCLEYDPMREPLSHFCRHFERNKLPLPILKSYIKTLLVGLDYLHSQCNVALLDIHLENIMVSFESPSPLSDFIRDQYNQPVSHKLDYDGRPVYHQCNDFGPLRRGGGMPRFIDLGSAQRFTNRESFGIMPFQLDCYRSPEMILGCGYRPSADVWNFGVMLWDLIEGKNLFTQIHNEDYGYSAKAHLAEMIAFLGPPPSAVLQRHRTMRGIDFPRHYKDALGENVEQYHGGPFFSENDRFLYEFLIPKRNFSTTLPSLDESERKKFLAFVKPMLEWNQFDRPTAGELAKHSWLDVPLGTEL
ncbi:kinase-like domain-containing protein [Aspergillus venezuelensis]